MADTEKDHEYAKNHHREVNSNIQSLISTTGGNEMVGSHEDQESIWTMSKHLGDVSIPIIIGQIFSLFVEMLNLVFAGRLGDPIYVAAAGLGNMYANVTCLLIIYGLNSAIATLVAQAYGAGNLRKCGIYLNKGRIAVVIFFIPIFIIMFFCERFLLAINMDPKASAIAQQYTYGLVVSLFFQA